VVGNSQAKREARRQPGITLAQLLMRIPVIVSSDSGMNVSSDSGAS
jgi:hypothetical protein